MDDPAEVPIGRMGFGVIRVEGLDDHVLLESGHVDVGRKLVPGAVLVIVHQLHHRGAALALQLLLDPRHQ